MNYLYYSYLPGAAQCSYTCGQAVLEQSFALFVWASTGQGSWWQGNWLNFLNWLLTVIRKWAGLSWPREFQLWGYTIQKCCRSNCSSEENPIRGRWIQKSDKGVGLVYWKWKKKSKPWKVVPSTVDHFPYKCGCWENVQHFWLAAQPEKSINEWFHLGWYYFLEVLLWTPKKVTKMSVSDLPYLLPSWQNILCSLFVRFCRQKTSFFSFFDKNKFSRNLEGLIKTKALPLLHG